MHSLGAHTLHEKKVKIFFSYFRYFFSSSPFFFLPLFSACYFHFLVKQCSNEFITCSDKGDNWPPRRGVWCPERAAGRGRRSKVPVIFSAEPPLDDWQVAHPPSPSTYSFTSLPLYILTACRGVHDENKGVDEGAWLRGQAKGWRGCVPSNEDSFSATVSVATSSSGCEELDLNPLSWKYVGIQCAALMSFEVLRGYWILAKFSKSVDENEYNLICFNFSIINRTHMSPSWRKKDTKIFHRVS